MKLYAVIPTHNRPAELAALLRTIPESVQVLVIDNASTPPLATPSGGGFRSDSGFDEFLGRRIQIYTDAEQPPNLSRLWNVGLDWAAHLFDPDPVCRAQRIDDYAVAILNDDVLLPPYFIDIMARELGKHAVDIAFPGPVWHAGMAGECRVNRRKGPPGTDHRMTGWCFVVRGSAGLRADERLRWWCGDDDLEQQALQGGRGTVRVPFPLGAITHRYPDQSTTGVLREQTEKDMETYVRKWGFRPW